MEHAMATQKRRAVLSLENSEAPVPVDGDDLLELPGVRRYLVNLAGRVLERTLIWRLDWLNLM